MKYILAIFTVLFYGCEKVIDVDLNEADPEIVIEANVSSYTGFGEVSLSQTASYFGESSIENISNASVLMENELGKRFELEEITEGYYRTMAILPEVGLNYKLIVEAEGERYESSSRLNPMVPIDSLQWFYDEGFAYRDGGYSVKISFNDPADVQNYYRIKVFENDTLVNSADDLVLFDDRLIDGQILEVSLQGFVFEQGDTVSVQLISLDRGAFEYYNTFRELTNVNPGSAAPANPTSNISNNALGFFSAWSADVESVIIAD